LTINRQVAGTANRLHRFFSRCMMPEFTNKDRQVVESEGMAWALLEGVRLMEHGLDDTAFHLAAMAVKEALLQLARDLREYNDQFDVEE